MDKPSDSVMTIDDHTAYLKIAKSTLFKLAQEGNPLALEPKIRWGDEDDAANYLSLIALLHRQLDDSVATHIGGPV